MTEDETVGWHHRLNGHGFEQTPGAGDGQGGLACCNPWGRKGSDTTERQQKHLVPGKAPRACPPGDLPDPAMEPGLLPCGQILYPLSH